MQYIAALDYEHLDNGMFLSSLARAISRQKDAQPIIVHGDSEYTNRIMQTGVMRDEATIRSIKDLNHRLVALFADEGVSTIGINGHQRKLIRQKNNQLCLDSAFFRQLPDGPALLISTLVWDEAAGAARPVSLPRLVSFLHKKFKTDSIYAFNKADEAEVFIEKNPEHLEWQNLPAEVIEKNLPVEFDAYNKPLHLTNVRDFGNLKNKNHSIFIE